MAPLLATLAEPPSALRVHAPALTFVQLPFWIGTDGEAFSLSVPSNLCSPDRA